MNFCELVKTKSHLYLTQTGTLMTCHMKMPVCTVVSLRTDKEKEHSQSVLVWRSLGVSATFLLQNYIFCANDSLNLHVLIVMNANSLCYFGKR